ncbi:quercetin dioxygenase-like cupin family protein [Kibdelosporangium banguiense]|uniref:Quercetin dioxygenase-like cupin family protein n=1 Tax=Kibdelosporangium banguiense TaxID=1365924 RepID=A0ABS4TVF5_9PSEU|nr:cupin domain-containing protein [Kibdelosporangium banguiense]MBP2327969.1 quercetin dioxygenase-like cupin family protein [Kibdelosporangium banguiense]
MSVHPQLEPVSERARWHLGGLLTIRAAAGDTNGAIAVVEERALRGYATPPHVHGREDETLFVIDGTLECTVDGVTGTVTAGSAVHLPRGRAHRFEVTSEKAHFLVIITPGGFEEFFQEVSPSAAAARVPEAHDHARTDPAQMVQAAAARGTTVFRDHETAALFAALTVFRSDDRAEVLQAYRDLGAALVEPAPLPACAGEVADMLVDTVTERLPADSLHARALILLGILVERHGIDVARWDKAIARLLRTIGPELDSAAILAMAYLLAHFPSHSAAVLDALRPAELPEADLQRLERCLAQPDFTSAETHSRIGRVWPSPALWQLDTGERELDETWRAGLRLDAGTAGELWESETVALLAYMGAKADHAVERNEHA